MTTTFDHVTSRAITAGIRELEHYIEDHPSFGDAMNTSRGPEVRIQLADEAEIDAFADHFAVMVMKAPVGDGWFMSATAFLEGVAVTAWARTYDEVAS